MKKSDNFVWGIAILRILAMILITNSHFGSIYPYSSMAFGGLLGNIIFFAVSGYCLTGIKDSFLKWYSKRVLRIYPQTIMMTVFSICLGFISFCPTLVNWWIRYFIYPTYYHFIGAILFCYLIYYWIIRIKALKENILCVIVGILLLQLVAYIVFFDKSFYNVDYVENNQFEFIRFLYLISMLIGVWFKENRHRIVVSRSMIYIGTVLSAVLYFVTKIFFSRSKRFLDCQIFNQYSILLLLVFILLLFLHDNRIGNLCERLPKKIQNILKYISELTLEVYLVQFLILKWVGSMQVSSPIKFICAIVFIFVGACVLHFLTNKVFWLFDFIKQKIRTSLQNAG